MYLTNKPVKELAKDQFLNITQATDDHLMTYDITIDDFEIEKQDPETRLQTYFEEIKSLYYRVSHSLYDNKRVCVLMSMYQVVGLCTTF